jgi:hypothetical protein
MSQRRSVPLSLAVLVLAVSSVACSEDGGTRNAPAATSVATPATTAPAEELSVESLPALAVRPEDLPAGFSLAQEGYVDAGAPIVSLFRRSFDPGGARLGASELVGLVSDVAIFPTPQAAEAALQQVFTDLTSEAAEANFATILQVYTGIEPIDLDGQTLAAPGIGDGAIAARAFFDSPDGRGEALLHVIRVGPLHANLFLVGQAGRVELEDGARLIAAVAARMEAAVAAAGPAA